MFGKKKDKDMFKEKADIKGSDIGIDGADFKKKQVTDEGTEVRALPYSVTKAEVKGEFWKDVYEFFKHNARFSIFAALIFLWFFRKWLSQNSFEIGIMAEFVIVDLFVAYFIASFIVRHGYRYIAHLHVEIPGLNTVIGINQDEPDALKSLLYEKSDEMIIKLFVRRQDHLTTRKTSIPSATKLIDRDGNQMLFTQHSETVGKRTVYMGTMSKRFISINVMAALFPLTTEKERFGKHDRLTNKRYVKAYNKLMRKAPRDMSPEENEKFIEAITLITQGESKLKVFAEDYKPVRVYFRGRDKAKKGYIFGISKEIRQRMIDVFGNPFDASDGKEVNRIKQLTNMGQNADIIIANQSITNAHHYARGQMDTLSGMLAKRYSEKTLSKEALLEQEKHVEALKQASDRKTDEDIMKEVLSND